MKRNNLAKYLKLLVTKTQKRRVGQARPDNQGPSPPRPDRLRPEPGPTRQTEARARSGFELGPGLRPLLSGVYISEESVVSGGVGDNVHRFPYKSTSISGEWGQLKTGNTSTPLNFTYISGEFWELIF